MEAPEIKPELDSGTCIPINRPSSLLLTPRAPAPRGIPDMSAKALPPLPPPLPPPPCKQWHLYHIC
ncbi:hypothetical protein DPMN_188614 [Dreissena polymorpha]|uniref:Uncharacterized protein n=1 Tax=Dreissena polymorpha TaxID=45954 RepID=A0A9D4DR32_DREPO|nr:hypothetical protein DPMN_188614 [Dreissena polymorpha]